MLNMDMFDDYYLLAIYYFNHLICFLPLLSVSLFIAHLVGLFKKATKVTNIVFLLLEIVPFVFSISHPHQAKALIWIIEMTL